MSDDPRQRYVIRWLAADGRTSRYVKVGGGYTDNLQEAMVAGWRSVKTKWGRYIEAGRAAAVPVRIVPE